MTSASVIQITGGFNDAGLTVDNFYRSGTQIELEEALACWLRKQIERIKQVEPHAQVSPAEDDGSDAKVAET